MSKNRIKAIENESIEEDFEKWCIEQEEKKKKAEKDKKKAEKDYAKLNVGHFTKASVQHNYKFGEFVPKYEQEYLCVTDKEGKTVHIGVDELLKMLSFCAGKSLEELPFWWVYYACNRYNMSPYDFFSDDRKEEVAININREYDKLYACGNHNMNNPKINNIFFDALKTYPDNLEGTKIHIADGDVSFCNRESCSMYDAVPQKIIPEKEWADKAYEWYLEAHKRENRILKKKGLLRAWNALTKWLDKNTEIPTIESDNMNGGLGRLVMAKTNRSLIYGYKVTGVTVFSANEIVWELTLFDRACSTYDILRGTDIVYLMYNGKNIKPAVTESTMKLYKGEDIDKKDEVRFVILE